jgi:hypothetical protein
MEKLFNQSFFRFLFGFLGILTFSLAVTLLAGFYDAGQNSGPDATLAEIEE